MDLVGKVMSLFFNMLSRLVIPSLPRSKWLLISWLQSQSAVIWEPKKIKSATVAIVCPSICHEVKGLDAMILVFCMLSFKSTFSLCMKRQKDVILKDELPRSIGAQYATGEEWTNNARKNERWSQSENNVQL